MYRLAALIVLLLPACAPAQWVNLFNGKNLDGWEPIGDGVWTVLRDGTLTGQRDVVKNRAELCWTREQYNRWMYHQAWLYTRKDFDEFDLHLEYWLRWGGNSGVSIRDSSRARVAVDPAFGNTPSHIGYEIQIANHYGDNYPTGSIYLFAKAKTGYQVDDDWNALDIEVRRGLIRVKVNGEPVAESAGDPSRPKTGPIGLQLHDQNSVAMFRNIRIREIPPK